MAVDILNLVLISVSCIVCCLLILLMVVVVYKKNPLCCRFRASTSEHNTDQAPHYNSRHTLVCSGNALGGAAMDQFTVGAQLPRRPFVIGKPTDYHMDGSLPRLPSYESVRRKDRQRQIHQMIAQRFGLISSQDQVPSQPPPTYDETLQQSPSHLTDSDLPTHSRDESSNRRGGTHSLS